LLALTQKRFRPVMADVLPDHRRAKHLAFYGAFALYCCCLPSPPPQALAFWIWGRTMAAVNPSAPLDHAWDRTYIAVWCAAWPDHRAFFLFFSYIALDQGIDTCATQVKWPDLGSPIRQGSDFLVCQAATMPLGKFGRNGIQEAYGFSLA